MLVCIGICHKDFLASARLFRWMVELDGQHERHSLVLVVSRGMVKHHSELSIKKARKAFKSVEVIMPNMMHEKGWPTSANNLFITAYHYANKLKQNFQWIESDCVPLCPGWLDRMESEYLKCGKPFMGCIYSKPFPHLTGCAIYPYNLEKYNPYILRPGERAWDVAEPGNTMPHTHHTELFQHEWGNHKYNISPSFSNQACLSVLRPQAVLFHRNKDQTLIERLRERKKHPLTAQLIASTMKGEITPSWAEDYEWKVVVK